MATPRIGGGGEPSWLAGYSSSEQSVRISPAQLNASAERKCAPLPPVAVDENGQNVQLELNEAEEMLLLIGELEEQLELERQRADVLERKAAFAAGVLPPDTSASPRELQLQREELLQFIGEMEEASALAAAQQNVDTQATPIARERNHARSPPPPPPIDSATKQTQLLSDADAWLTQSAQLARASPRTSSTAASPAAELAVPLRNLVRGVPAEGTPARRLMEEARVLRQMIAARSSPRPHSTSGPSSCGGSSRKKKALAQRAPLQRLSSNFALTPRQTHAAVPPPLASPLTTTRVASSLPGCQTARSCAASALGVDASAISDRIVLFFVSKMQAWARAVLVQRRYRRQRSAAIVIQRHTRCAAGREHAERLRQAELATFLTPFKYAAVHSSIYIMQQSTYIMADYCRCRAPTDTDTDSDTDTDTDATKEATMQSTEASIDDDADHSLTAEEEAEWDQWLERAKAAEEAAKVQHQFALQQQEQQLWRQQQASLHTVESGSKGNESVQNQEHEFSLSGVIESVDV